MDDIRIVLIFFIAYIYGSIHPTSIIAKKIIGIDLNKKGSSNQLSGGKINSLIDFILLIFLHPL